MGRFDWWLPALLQPLTTCAQWIEQLWNQRVGYSTIRSSAPSLAPLTHPLSLHCSPALLRSFAHSLPGLAPELMGNLERDLFPCNKSINYAITPRSFKEQITNSCVFATILKGQLVCCVLAFQHWFLAEMLCKMYWSRKGYAIKEIATGRKLPISIYQWLTDWLTECNIKTNLGGRDADVDRKGIDWDFVI